MDAIEGGATIFFDDLFCYKFYQRSLRGKRLFTLVDSHGRKNINGTTIY